MCDSSGQKCQEVVVWKDKKGFSRGRKIIYTAPTIRAADAALKNFDNKWGSKYKYAVEIWKNSWDNLSVFFEFPIEIRKIIYTTNPIENLNEKNRKYTKNKLSFPADQVVMKSVYLSVKEATKE